MEPAVHRSLRSVKRSNGFYASSIFMEYKLSPFVVFQSGGTENDHIDKEMNFGNHLEFVKRKIHRFDALA